MKIMRNPSAAIGIEPLSGKIRILASPSVTGPRPAYVGACTTLAISPTELIITALAGQGISRAHLRLIAAWAREAGYRWIYAERLPGHTLPLARRRTARPLDGWFEIDLEQLPSAIAGEDADHA
jgi:hypothetical protein